jgi:hypothetical protein
MSAYGYMSNVPFGLTSEVTHSLDAMHQMIPSLPAMVLSPEGTLGALQQAQAGGYAMAHSFPAQRQLPEPPPEAPYLYQPSAVLTNALFGTKVTQAMRLNQGGEQMIVFVFGVSRQLPGLKQVDGVNSWRIGPGWYVNISAKRPVLNDPRSKARRIFQAEIQCR